MDASLIEELDLTIWPEELSFDAWPEYNRLLADGKVSVGLHFGWDYHGEYHLVHSKAIYNWLVERGFTSPVEKYEDYNHESGALRKEIDVNGKNVVFEISLYYGQEGGLTDPDTDAGGILLEDLMRQSFKSREVIIFSGHSGPFYGFALANWRRTSEGEIDDSEIAGLEMPENTYQMVLAEGCETYAIGEAFWHNPFKLDRTNLDIITTANFSDATSNRVTKDFLRALMGNLESNAFEPKTYKTLLKRLDLNNFWLIRLLI